MVNKFSSKIAIFKQAVCRHPCSRDHRPWQAGPLHSGGVAPSWRNTVHTHSCHSSDSGAEIYRVIQESTQIETTSIPRSIQSYTIRIQRYLMTGSTQTLVHFNTHSEVPLQFTELLSAHETPFSHHPLRSLQRSEVRGQKLAMRGKGGATRREREVPSL